MADAACRIEVPPHLECVAALPREVKGFYGGGAEAQCSVVIQQVVNKYKAKQSSVKAQ